MLGYCTNVHAGHDLETTRSNLAQHAVRVKQLFSPQEPLGVGLWLSASTARGLRDQAALADFGGWLEEAGLIPYTLNGFPYGDFHRRVVKHDVYQPTWLDPARLEYTIDLINILHALLPPQTDATISTLPLAWGTPTVPDEDLAGMAKNLRTVATHLERLEDETGRRIALCLEPEPGCVLQRCEDVVRFFDRFVVDEESTGRVRRYLQVCHDVCHAVVMFEPQSAVLRRFQEAGIGVGKVQVSSAVVLAFDALTATERSQAVDQLREFAEDRYLHQTVTRQQPDGETQFFQDLPQLLEMARDGSPQALCGEWRVHFHVPIYLEQFELLRTSRAEILACMDACAALPDVPQFEVETYAWDVLPQVLQQHELASGIAAELEWLRSVTPVS